MELITQLIKKYYNKQKEKVVYENEKEGYRGRGLTYVKGLSENIKKALKNDITFNISFKNSNTIRKVTKVYKNGKDGTDFLNKSNVIYHIPCGSCSGTYNDNRFAYFF